MAKSLELIGSYVLSSPATTFDFTSLPTTYTDLLVYVSGRSTAAGGGTGGSWDNVRMNFNGDTSGNYQVNFVFEIDSGTPTASGDSAGLGVFAWMDYSGATANSFSNIEHYISNYASTTAYKAVQTNSTMENNSNRGVWALGASNWKSNSAINRVTLTPNTGNFDTYSSCYLYGIKKS